MKSVNIVSILASIIRRSRLKIVTYVKFLPNVTVTGLRFEVDRRMRMETFEKHLEPYIEAPRAYFKLCTDGKAHGNAYLSYNSKLVTSLRNVENNSQLHVRLTRAPEPGATSVTVYFLELSRGLSISYFCDYCIDDEKTVGETKKELLEDVEIMYSIRLEFDRYCTGCCLNA